MSQLMYICTLCLGLLGTALSSLSRDIVLTNLCDDDIWLSFTAGAAPYANGGSICSDDADCLSGSVCNKDNGICFWDVPVPSTGSYRLSRAGGTSNITFPIMKNDVVWSGNIRVCVNGTCDSSPDECDKVGCGIVRPSPITLVEFTLSQSNVDFYDISILNGFNMAVEMSPIGQFPLDTTKPYDCGNPGGKQALTGYGECTWLFIPPASEFVWVQDGNEDLVVCSFDADCVNFPGTVCGMSRLATLTCGSPLGYWTLDQFCGENMDQIYTAVDCHMPLPAPNDDQTLWNLLGCVDIPSCYQSESGPNCCGCVDWQLEIEAVSPLTEKCQYTNPNWLADVKPTLSFMKQACPSAYTYPYDDHSSTFVCAAYNAENINTVEYAITYCP